MNPILTTLIISFLIQIFFFIFAASFKTDKVTDLSYGLSFIALSLYSLLTNGTFFLTQIIITSLIVLWGVRLAGYLLIRILKIKKDARFDGMREDFVKFAKFWTFQAVTAWIIMLPATFVLNSSVDLGLSTLSYIGIGIWIFGFIVETIADYQKFVFKNKNPKKFIQTGLYKYSRYPNYFGEITLWWGLFIVTIPYLSGISWFTVLGPMFITFILLFVSGIPLLEKRFDANYKDNKEFQEYKKRTSKLILWWPKK